MIGIPTVHLIARLRRIVDRHPDLRPGERRAIEDAQVVMVCAIGRMAAKQRRAPVLRAARIVMTRHSRP